MEVNIRTFFLSESLDTPLSLCMYDCVCDHVRMWLCANACMHVCVVVFETGSHIS